MTTKPKASATNVRPIAPTKPLQVIEATEINRHPSPRLGTAAEVRMEMARLYREARTGQMGVGDATKLAYLLTQCHGSAIWSQTVVGVMAPPWDRRNGATSGSA